MVALTEEQIAAKAEKLSTTELGAIRVMNRLFREQDDSHLYPISGRFNATERAIRRTRAFMRDYGALSPLEYAYHVYAEISQIVNTE